MNTEFSIIALLVSLLSAIYTRWAAVQAKQANRIALHEHKLEILNAFNQFRAALSPSAKDFNMRDLYPLLNATDKAKFYFKPSTINDLRQYADAAYDLLISWDGARRLQSVGRDVPTAKWNEIFSKVDDCRALEPNLSLKLEAETQIAGA